MMADLSEKTILIVDDQEFVRTIVSSMLKQIGVTKVLEATDGDHAIEQVLITSPDLVICDVQMRPTDGFTFVRKLHENFQTKNIPVIMLTAHCDSVTVNMAQGMKIDAFISKPVLPATLAATINQVLTCRKIHATQNVV
jgi:two-component system, chemotaxis family, chemotaxis protein CheY